MAKVALKAEAKLARLVVQAATDRAEMLQHLLQYAQTDLLCYRAPSFSVIPAQAGIQPNETALALRALDFRLRGNDDLERQQEKIFAPILDWLAGQGMTFTITDAVIPVVQPSVSLEKLAALYAQASDRELASLSLMVPLLGSALLAFAVWKKRVTVDEALLAARLDEDHQSARWGTDQHEAANWAAKADDICAAAFFLAAVE